MKDFFESEWFLPTALTVIGLLEFLVFWLLKRREMQLATADQRIGEAFQRNVSELPEIDGGSRG